MTSKLNQKTIEENKLLKKHGYVEGGDNESNKHAINYARERQGQDPIYKNMGITEAEVSTVTDDKSTISGVTTQFLSNLKNIFK